MEHISEVVTGLLAVAGIVTALGGAWSYISKWRAESRGTKNAEIIEQHTEQLRKIDERLLKLEKANRDQDLFVKTMCETMLAMLDHSITGNSVEKLKKARDEMNDFLIHRGGG